MADDKPVKHRIVKNPETFRERAVKANEMADKPSRKRQLVSAPFRGIGWVFRQVAKPFKWFFKLKIFRPLAKPVRIVGHIIVPRYVRNSWKELRQVTWPNWNQSRRLTSAVLIFALIFGVMIAIVDFGLDKLFKTVLLK